MKHVLGIGGIFFKAENPDKLGAWYKEHLGLDVEEYGGVTFREGQKVEDGSTPRQAYTVWSPFDSNTDYFFCQAPSLS